MQPKNDQVNESLCIIATGSNLPSGLRGEQPAVGTALELLSRESLKILHVSPSYRSPAFPAGSGPDYVNGAVLVSTRLSREETLAVLHKIEKNVGRTRRIRWEPRVIDLDLIDYAGQIAPDMAEFKTWFEMPLKKQMEKAPEQLILPHPRLQDRPFVLIPMRDIAPNWRHPVTGSSVSQMLARFSRKELSEIQQIEGDESAS
ncbi:MAG: 2-amino-4-hydroxy-6-hydroxymethyldihydropteridine diphosphokinase [Rhodobacteraceae bacterium]|nr:2-amino-4-hydroxy-6-hydroxymethyldihydropteridine diphosphokinase [Paracoccaceae bacterium]